MVAPSVSHVVKRYFSCLAAENVDFLGGVYLLGSVALGDYQEGRSDIDFVAVADRPLDGDKITRLRRVHAAMAGAPAFDGFYVEARHLAGAPRPEHAAAFVVDGLFHPTGPCFEANPVTWRLWAHHGIALAGPAPAGLGLLLDDAALRRFELSNLEGYWRGWIDRTRATLPAMVPTGRTVADIVAWGVLGIARIACTLETGRIVSKSGAGRWALDRCQDRDTAIVEAALTIRRGEIADLPIDRAEAALAFMERCMSQTLALNRLPRHEAETRGAKR